MALAAIRNAVGVVVDFQVVAFNDGATRLLGVEDSTLRWCRLSELPLGVPSAELIKHLLGAVSTGQTDNFELALPRGEIDMFLNVGIASVGDLLSMTLTDIGELKRREASFRLLFDGNPVPMWLYDPQDLRILSVNDAAVAHYGYSRGRWQSMTLYDLWPKDEWDLHREVARSVGQPHHSDRTWRHIKADGTEIEVLTYARQLPFSEKNTILVAVVDVTERKAGRSADRLYGASRRADRSAEPRAVPRRLNEAARARAPARREPRGTLPRSRPFQGASTTRSAIRSATSCCKAVARRLRAALRETDMVARLGGDEFAVVQTAARRPRRGRRARAADR